MDVNLFVMIDACVYVRCFYKRAVYDGSMFDYVSKRIVYILKDNIHVWPIFLMFETVGFAT